MSTAALIVVPAAVALLSVTVSLDLAVADIRSTLRQRRVLVTGLLAQMSVLPLLALAVGALSGDPVIAIALLLVGLVPSGPTSNYIVGVGGGDVSLAIVLTVIGTLLTVVTLPPLLGWLAALSGGSATAITPPVAQLLQGLVVMVLVPVSIGIFLARRYPQAVRRARPLVSRAAAIVFGLIVVGAILAERHALAATFARSLPWVVGLNLSAMAAGWLITRWAGWAPRQATVLPVKCALQNVSVAIAIALAGMGRTDIAAVAGLYGLCQLLTATVFALRRRAPPAQPAQA